VRDCVARAVAVVGLGGLALIHLLAAPGEFDEIPYQGWLFVGLIPVLLALAGVLLWTSDDRAWLAAGGLAATVKGQKSPSAESPGRRVPIVRQWTFYSH
jgi:hypothetical protein